MATKNPTEKVKKPKKVRKLKKKIKLAPKVSCEQLVNIYENKTRDQINLENKQDIQFLECMSKINREIIEDEKSDDYDFLYPNKNDRHFNKKIARKKEFFDARYEEKKRSDFDNIEEITDQICNNREFELQPHQMFVRNFLSFHTPYNSLLLFHGLGTGKTCSSISVCEEMRTYNIQMGISKRIIVVASPAVQDNFKIQLFDPSKLKEVNGLWNIKACTGNKFIKEINPMNMKGLSRKRVENQIKKIIRQYYLFQGYGQFSNYISRIMERSVSSNDSDEIANIKRAKALKKEFSNRMIVIDEIHNMRLSEDGNIKSSSENLTKLVSTANNIKLLILSATPMFNSYKEIIWLLNILNLNDKRYPILEKDVFDKNGNFKVDKRGNEIGKNLLIQKSIGYVSYVRGENPFTFPNSIYPSIAENPNSLLLKMSTGWDYPIKKINGGDVKTSINLMDLVLTNIGEYQQRGYDFVVNSLKKKYPALNNPSKGLSYTMLESPLQCLNMVYPHTDLDTLEFDDAKYLYGKRGLARIMLFNPASKKNFRYKDKTLQNFGRVFSPSEIGKYSAKIKYIIESIKKSKGIVFIYSQYIDGGAVPIALALEELGITRYGSSSLFSEPPTVPLDAKTMQPAVDGKTKYPAKYMMIIGDKQLTGDRTAQIKAATAENNKNGEIIKVIIISKAGSEGLDFKNIREMHVIDPWYNYNRQKQIIGRAIRNLSHCMLPYEERNCSIFLYGTLLKQPTIEAVDLYIYRLAEKKALQIARVSRLLKENAVDCLLNRDGLNFSESHVNKVVRQKLSDGKVIRFRLGDKENSDICDFTSCEYKCNPDDEIGDEIDTVSYNENFINMNLDKILQRIRNLFRERYFYEKTDLIMRIRHMKNYPLDQIYSALEFLVTEENEYITDMLGRMGHLVNVGNYYLYQPLEIESKHITRFERVHPIDYKRKLISFKLPDEIPNFSTSDKEIIVDNERKQTDLGETKLGVDTKERDNTIIEKLNEILTLLKSPQFIKTDQKNNWVLRCSWAIDNLHKYNQIPKELLLQYALDHILDSYSYNIKLELLKYVTVKFNEGNMTELDNILMNYFEQYKIKADNYEGIVLVRLDRPSNYEKYTILTNVDGDWKIDKASFVNLARAMFNKFKVLNIDLINSFIGFMIDVKKDEIVFKIKNIGESDKGRSNKGIRCGRGESKKVIIKRLNDLLPEKNGLKKYTMGAKHKSTIIQIYENSNDIKQYATKKTIKKEVSINSIQLCAETELILRHYQNTKKDGKFWFFNLLTSILNNIENLKN